MAEAKKASHALGRALVDPRKKFEQSIPGVVTDNYLATVLNMGVESVRANVLPFLKPLGIIDDEGKTTEWASNPRATIAIIPRPVKLSPPRSTQIVTRCGSDFLG